MLLATLIDLLFGGTDFSEPDDVKWFVSVVVVCVPVMTLGYVWYRVSGSRDPPVSDWRKYRITGSYVTKPGSRSPDNWQELRQQALEQDNYKCGNCGSTRNLHVHHIVPLSKGGSNEPGNLRTLCRTCHTKLHPLMRD